MSNFRSDFHVELAQLFLDDILYQRSKYYYFLGKVDPWATGLANDIPPQNLPIDSQSENTIIRSNMIFAKRISPADVSLACRNYPWELGLVFDKWDHTQDMREQMFFTITDDYRVYKCLDNANGGESSIKPTGTAIAPVRLEDGYLWKYMYTIPSFKRGRFITVNNIPVQRALTDNFFNRGELEGAVVVNKGSGYSATAQSTITVSDIGKTVGSGASGTLTLGTIGNITGVTNLVGGTGYTKGVKIDITTSSGSGAVLTPVITGGVVTGVTVTSPGIGYALGDTITFRVGGATIIPKISTAGSVVGVIITDPGAGYNLAPTLTLIGGGTGKYGNSSAILTAVVYNGSVQTVSITDPGINYQDGEGPVIFVQGDGENAQLSPVVYNGEIIDVILENPGSGYTNTIVSVVNQVGASGSGAVINAVIDQSDYESDQSIIEQTAVSGAIYSIGIADGGNGYTPKTPGQEGTTISIEGDGTGCTATCEVEDGVIVRTRVTNFGSGYSYARVVINDPGVVPGQGAELYAILPPPGGHGSNAPVELFGDTVALHSSLRPDVVATNIVQDYRQFGILKNPRDSFSFANYVNASALILYKASFVSVANLVKDEVLLQGTKTFIVADIVGSDVYLLQTNSVGTLTTGNLITADNTRTYNCDVVLSTPSFNKYSGSLLYMSNEGAFTFNETQGIIIKTLIQF